MSLTRLSTMAAALWIGAGCQLPVYVESTTPATGGIATSEPSNERQNVAGRDTSGLSEALAFQSQARGLRNTQATANHQPEVAAMRTLADALSAASGSLPTVARSADRIRTDAADIALSSPQSMSHQVWAKTALKQAIASMDTMRSDKRFGSFDKQLDQARSAVDAIDPDIAFLKQRDTIDTAFNAVADALVAAMQTRTR